MSGPIQGKLAIITGASRGLGAALAQHLAAKGAHVVINYASDDSTDAAKAVASEIEAKHNVRAVLAQCDITTQEGPQKLIEIAKSHFTSNGQFQIAILINNAGVVNPAPMGSVTFDEFDKTFALNARAPLFVTQAAIPYLPKDRSGRIVNVSSITTSMGFWWQSCYAGTKGALEAMTRVWARELAEHATVNSINPGAMLTGMYSGLPQEMLEKVWSLNYMAPLARTREGIDKPEIIDAAKGLGGRPAYLEEVAGIVGLLCAPEAGWITGQVIGANGGGVMTKG
ncbi:NAD(P)-binding protein [Aaosphaeria arxii CBS 175.79]|uniref:NAD(P)-binding protein n=1 Tax=Aaosphaeria arxii CBS 175.79 TaxID=1450172 RepID=A0A6A5XF14_9PLEO|nr:NAD(P)-binding protein [Aaosphaeria arxii CBS 175.79]KAF2011407.1 NAD(P)-binding protein [Aaosphaeria arxii CBS 175.79]